MRGCARQIRLPEPPRRCWQRNFATTGNIALTSGQLDITDSLMINGPGESALTVSHCTISRNHARGGAGAIYISFDGDGGHGEGGGLYVQGGMVQVNQSTVSVNQAVGGNGGDAQWTYDLDSYGGNGGWGGGGGIRVAGGSVQILQSSIFDNGAVGGSGGLGTWNGQPNVGMGAGARYALVATRFGLVAGAVSSRARLALADASGFDRAAGLFVTRRVSEAGSAATGSRPFDAEPLMGRINVLFCLRCTRSPTPARAGPGRPRSSLDHGPNGSQPGFQSTSNYRRRLVPVTLVKAEPSGTTWKTS